MKRHGIVASISFFLMIAANSHAFFDSSDNLIDSVENTANNLIDEKGEITSEMILLISKLSDDIGLMADRIGEMADRIGEMADRIVATEQLMAEFVLALQENKLDAGAGSDNDAVILFTPYGTTLYGGELPVIETSNNATEYLMFASPEVTIGDNAASALIPNANDLVEQWPGLASLAVDNKLYIAVKTIDGNNLSSLSNSVLLRLY